MRSLGFVLDPVSPMRSDELRQLIALVLERREQGLECDLAEICQGDVEGQKELKEHLDAEQRAATLLRTSSARLEIPRETFRGFELLMQLGQGGMGQVFLAREESLGRLVSLKVLDPHRLSDTRARERFLQEARMVASLNHSAIVPIHAVLESGDRVILVMKWLTGPSLDQRSEPLEPMRCAAIGVEIAEALHEAHLAGIVHRDVKPANIVMDGDRPYLIDFGLAKGQDQPTLTSLDGTPGTLAYMPPERMRPGATHLDPRFDVYGLAASLYQLLEGRAPFNSLQPEILVRDILLRDPTPLLLSGRLRDLEAIVFKGLEKNPADRFASAREFADELRRFLDDRPVRSRPLRWPRRMWRAVIRRPRASIATLFVILLLGTLTAWVLIREAQRLETVTTAEASIVAALESGDVRAAETGLSLLASHTSAGGLMPWSVRIATLKDLETFVDLCQDRPEARDDKRLEELADSIGKRRLELRGLMGATFEIADVLRRFEGLAPPKENAFAFETSATLLPRARACVIDLAKQRTLDSYASGDLASAEEEVFVALVLRQSGVPLSVRRTHLERCLENGMGTSVRMKIAYGHLLADEGKHESAVEVFRLLALDHPRELVIRSLAYELLLSGNPEAASAALESYAFDPMSSRALAVLYIDVRRRCLGKMASSDQTKSQDDYRELLSSAKNRWPDDPRLLALDARESWDRREFDAAARGFQRIITIAPATEFARSAEVALLYVEATSAGFPEPGDVMTQLEVSEEQQEAARDIAERASELAELVRGFSRSQALLLAAKLHRVASRNRDLEVYENRLRKVLRIQPDNPHALAEAARYGWQVVVSFLGQDGRIRDAEAFLERGDCVLWALGSARTLLGLMGGSATEVQPLHVQTALESEALIAFTLGDHVAARASASRCLEWMLQQSGPTYDGRIRLLRQILAR